MSSEEEWIYSPWGYGKLIERTADKATVELQSGGKLYVNPSSLSSSVQFSVKTFASERKVFDFEWAVTQDFSSLFPLIHKQLGLSPNIILKIHFIKGKLQALSPTDTPLKLGLKSHSKLICMIANSFIWDESRKSESIQLLEGSLAVCKKEGTDISYDTVLGNTCFTSGTHIWEIRLDFLVEYGEEEEIFIGVARPKVELNKHPTEEEYWGFMCLGRKKFGNGLLEDYGEALAAGDTLGIKLEYKENKGCLSFFKNKIELGQAFSEVPAGVSPALTMNYPKIVVKLNNNN